jgi:hypothetical protein
MKEPAGLESSVGDTKRLCQGVNNLLAKYGRHLTASATSPLLSRHLAGILEALVVKEDGKDPLVAAVRRYIIIVSDSVFSMLMMHEVEFDADKVTCTYPKDKDGCDIAPKAYLERARNLSARMTSFSADRNEKRAAAKARKRSASGAASSRAAGSST